MLFTSAYLQEITARVGLRKYAPPSRTGGLLGVEDANGASASRAPSMPARQHAKVNEYIVGQQLDEALAAGEDIIVSWPFENGDIKDFYEAEALWYVSLLL